MNHVSGLFAEDDEVRKLYNYLTNAITSFPNPSFPVNDALAAAIPDW
jgi:hypothetical protein